MTLTYCSRLLMHLLIGKILAIFRCFVSKNINMLKRGFLMYVRPLLEYNSVIYGHQVMSKILIQLSGSGVNLLKAKFHYAS